jgi:hypothetical protein
MTKQKPLWERLYQEPAFYELAREVGYAGCTYCQLCEHIEDLGKLHGKQRVESASYHLFTFEGDGTVNPKPLAKVSLRQHVRKIVHHLLGPDPEIPFTDMVAEILRPEETSRPTTSCCRTGTATTSGTRPPSPGGPAPPW